MYTSIVIGSFVWSALGIFILGLAGLGGVSAPHKNNLPFSLILLFIYWPYLILYNLNRVLGGSGDFLFIEVFGLWFLIANILKKFFNRERIFTFTIIFTLLPIICLGLYILIGLIISNPSLTR